MITQEKQINKHIKYTQTQIYTQIRDVTIKFANSSR